VWRELDKIRDRGWRHESGRLLRIQAMLVDCKFRTDDVLSYCKSRAGRWVFAARGTGEKGRELVLGHNAKNAYRARVYNLCSDSGRETVFDRLLIDSAGPGFIHIPMPDKEGGRWAWSNEEFIEQLLAEVPKYKWTRRWGRTRFWDPVRDRNEAWDLSVFCLAALRIRPHLIRDMAELVAKWREPLKEGEDPGGELAEDEPTPPPASPRGRWMRGWRG
jgi:phage terminase large subunit GpA-like protein